MQKEAGIGSLSGELRRLIARREFAIHFQPILGNRGGNASQTPGRPDARLLGHEALARGPVESALRAPLDLLHTAESCNLSLDLDQLLIEIALQRFTELAGKGRLFVNVLPMTLIRHADFAGWLRTSLKAVGLRPRDLVLEITEHGLVEDPSRMREAVQPVRELGCEIAIDDLGAGSSGLKIWSELRPDYVKIDRYFVSIIETDAVAAEVLRSMLDMAHVMGSRVIAEGIETAAQCRLIREQGVDYLQGYFLGRPQRDLQSSCAALIELGDAQALLPASCAEQLAIPRPPVRITTRVADVVALFQTNSEWDSLAVVDDGRAVGFVRRDELLTFLSKPLYPEIFNRKPVTRVMDPRPLVIDARARLEQVSRLITNTSAARLDMEFIVSQHGSYLGIGRTVELLRQITAQQVQAAKQSNPLTLLPGNREIEQQLARVLALRVPFLLCHGDLDSFKPFNDEYGYSHGDQALLHVADLFRGIASHSVDFVGHLGGDDFILIMRSPDWRIRLQRLFESFNASMPNLYSTEHRERGALAGRDRDGQPREFPLMTLSLAAVLDHGGRFSDCDAMNDVLRRAKVRAKARQGNALVLDDEVSVTDVQLDYQSGSNSARLPAIRSA